MKGNGTHQTVPPPMQSRVELYKSTFKVLSNSQLQPSFKSFEKKPTHNKIDWDIRPIN